MIRLVKTAIPKVLADNCDKWTKEYCDCFSRGEIPDKKLATAYNKPAVKKALEAETNGKCAYCECKIKHNSHGDIEHILPKNKDARPDLCFEWDNLTLACAKCNQSEKKDYYDVALPLINPYIDYPENRFVARGGMIFHVHHDNSAKATVSVLNLNRIPLLERRAERISSIENLLALWIERADTDPLRKIIENELHKGYEKDKEFSFTVKSHLANRSFPVKAT
jgi:uncharacterized protein (TIGR02646 family)